MALFLENGSGQSIYLVVQEWNCSKITGVSLVYAPRSVARVRCPMTQTLPPTPPNVMRIQRELRRARTYLDA